MIITLLTISLCGVLADLPEGECETLQSWEYAAVTQAEAASDLKHCRARQIAIEAVHGNDYWVECDQFVQGAEHELHF